MIGPFRAHQARWTVIALTAFALLAGGLVAAALRGGKADHYIRKQLADQAAALSRTLNPDRIETLSFTLNDRFNPSFLRLRQQMMAYAQASPLANYQDLQYLSIYSMIQRDGQFIFGPESIDASDQRGSHPGSVYE